MTPIPVAQPLRRQLNRALHELRRPVQALALRPDPPAELDAIAAAVAEIDAIVNPRAEPARAHPCRLSLMIAIQNVVLNALEHGTGSVEITATRQNGGEVVVRNPVAPLPAQAPPASSLTGHGLAIARAAARELGGRLEFDVAQGEAVAALRLSPAETAPGHR